ncbi:UNVERIFIED_CONTAM: hypothetical protein FKN15_062719 [Acipenser sinensis]
MSLISLLLAHTATVSLALVLTAFIFLYFFLKSSKSSNYNFPPGPPALPVIGNLNILDLHRPYKTLSKLYNMFPFLGFFLSDHKKVQTNGTMFQGYFRNTYKDRKDSVDSNDLRSFIDTFISRQREEVILAQQSLAIRDWQGTSSVVLVH